MTGFTESIVEEAALAWFHSLGWTVLHGPEIAAGMPGAERSDPGYRDVILPLARSSTSWCTSGRITTP